MPFAQHSPISLSSRVLHGNADWKPWKILSGTGVKDFPHSIHRMGSAEQNLRDFPVCGHTSSPLPPSLSPSQLKAHFCWRGRRAGPAFPFFGNVHISWGAYSRWITWHAEGSGTEHMALRCNIFREVWFKGSREVGAGPTICLGEAVPFKEFWGYLQWNQMWHGAKLHDTSLRSWFFLSLL